MEPKPLSGPHSGVARPAAPKLDARSFVRQCFPEIGALIERAYRNSPSFRDLCQDYRNCAVALDRWIQLAGDEPAQRVEEYTELLAELAAEVESWIVEMQKDETSRSKDGDR